MAPTQFEHGSHAKPSWAHSDRTSASKLASLTRKAGRLQLGVDFQPTKYSVICGRGRSAFDHTGNQRLRMIASTFVADYSQASKKLTKSAIVSNTVATIRRGGGHFCKYENGSWFEVGEFFAHAKVSAFFRDRLHEQYRSSTKAKITRRKQKDAHTQQYYQQLVDGTGYLNDSTRHLDDYSIMSSRSESSNDSLGFPYSMEVDFFDIDDVFQN
jgi:hypothetical protein